VAEKSPSAVDTGGEQRGEVLRRGRWVGGGMPAAGRGERHEAERLRGGGRRQGQALEGSYKERQSCPMEVTSAEMRRGAGWLVL